MFGNGMSIAGYQQVRDKKAVGSLRKYLAPIHYASQCERAAEKQEPSGSNE